MFVYYRTVALAGVEGDMTVVTEIWGPPQKRGPPSPYLREIWGSLCKYRDPSCRAGPSFFSLWLNFEMAQEGRFLYKDIYNYIEEGIYPENYQKQDKLALRKRAKYFQIVEGSLHYVGGKG